MLFRSRPLFGKHILLAGTGESVLEAKELLQEEGAEVTTYSAIQIVEKPENLIKEIETIKQYTWIFFTSVSSVEIFFHTMKKIKKDIRDLQGVSIFCIGEKTKEAVEKRGIFVDKVPQQYNSKSAVEEMEQFLSPKDKILFPASELAGTMLQEKVKNMGVEMVRVTAYENYIHVEEGIKQCFQKRMFDAVGFFSSSQAKNLFSMVGEDIKHCALFAIGEATAQSIYDMGGKVTATAEIATGKGLSAFLKKSLAKDFDNV